jgi:hypothetical protein
VWLRRPALRGLRLWCAALRRRSLICERLWLRFCLNFIKLLKIVDVSLFMPRIVFRISTHRHSRICRQTCKPRFC